MNVEKLYTGILKYVIILKADNNNERYMYNLVLCEIFWTLLHLYIDMNMAVGFD